jgi:hypothetical protein
MRKILLLPLILLVISCTQNKPVVEKLDLDDVAKLVKQDSLYEKVILDVESVRSKFEQNIVLMSKFKDLTYSDLLDYKKKTSDTTLLKNIFQEADSLYSIDIEENKQTYKHQIDSLFNIYKKIQEENDPEKYFKVEFSSIEKEYYSYGNGIKNINVKFKVTPLQGPIQGGSFRYKIIPKVTNKEVADAGCRFSSFTKNPSIYIWEAPYDIEDEFENATTSSIKENYNFEYTYLTVRKEGKTMSSLDLYTEIPITYKIYLDQDSLDLWDYKYIMEEEFQVSIKSSYEIAEDLFNKKKQSMNKLAYDFENLTGEIN